MRFASLITSLVLAFSLAACAAPAPATGDLASTPPPKSTPYPPRVVPKATVIIDTTCKTSADCAVKDVGNCCGAMPACVNKDSPTDPAAVQAQCQAKGMAGICGFREISACQCDNGQCVEASSSSDLRGPSLPAAEAQ